MTEKTRNARRRLVMGVAAAAFVALLPLATGMGSAQEGTRLLVDDAQTANASLVAVNVADPSGLGVSGLTLQAPAGYEISAIAAGLDRPRFMTFDAAGNLL